MIFMAWVLCGRCHHEFYGDVDDNGKLLTKKCNWCNSNLDQYKVLDVYKSKGLYS